MTISVVSLQVQINSGGPQLQAIVPISAQSDGTAYVLGSVPFLGGAPVSPTNPLATQKVVPSLAYIGPGQATVQTASGTLVALGTYTRTFTIATLPGSTGNVWLNTGPAAVVDMWGFVAADGGSFTFGTDAYPLPTTPLMAITDGGSPQVVVISGG